MLTFTLREAPPERLDLSVITPAGLAGLSCNEIERLVVGTTRLAPRIGDLFTLTGKDRSELRLEGGSDRLDNIGAGISGGCIRVEGSVGQRLGFNMSGRHLEVAGDAGPFAGAGATSGLIRICGNAAEHAGGAVHGGRHGLAGATLQIDGNAGARLGDRMRRGLILVRGRAGDHAGSRMIAGTIVARAIGDEPGLGMRRGALIASRHSRLLPTFADTGVLDFVFLRLLRGKIAGYAEDLSAMLREEARLYVGDQATLGRGEIIICD